MTGRKSYVLTKMDAVETYSHDKGMQHGRLTAAVVAATCIMLTFCVIKRIKIAYNPMPNGYLLHFMLNFR